MSFILDALKKSESDRQRQSGPSLFEVKVAPPRRTLPVWAMAIAVLLGINIIVISWMLLRRAPEQRSAAANTPAAAPAAQTADRAAGMSGASESAPAAATAANNAPARAAPALVRAPAPPAAAVSGSGDAAPTAAAVGAPPASPADQSAGTPAADADSSAYAPAIEPSAAEGAGAQAGITTGALPLYQQIVTSDGLPALHLDLHVFAANPKDRFVMINMHRLGEGDSLPNGVRVQAIRPDGVVLSYRGTRFLLPRD